MQERVATNTVCEEASCPKSANAGVRIPPHYDSLGASAPGLASTALWPMGCPTRPWIWMSPGGWRTAWLRWKSWKHVSSPPSTGTNSRMAAPGSMPRTIGGSVRRVPNLLRGGPHSPTSRGRGLPSGWCWRRAPPSWDSNLGDGGPAAPDVRGPEGLLALHLLPGSSKAIDPTPSPKTGIILGMGRGAGEIRQAMADLREASWTSLTLGDSTSVSSPQHIPVPRGSPRRSWGCGSGYREAGVGSGTWQSDRLGPSSYHAKEQGPGAGRPERPGSIRTFWRRVSRLRRIDTAAGLCAFDHGRPGAPSSSEALMLKRDGDRRRRTSSTGGRDGGAGKASPGDELH